MANRLGIRCLLLLLVYTSSTFGASTTTPRLAPPTTLRSCWELYHAGYNSDNSWQNGLYFIDPDGPGTGESSFQVYCDLTNGNTEIGHDHESEEFVPNSFVEPGSWSVPITYDGTLDQVQALIDVSDSCQQAMTYNCQGAPIWDENQKALSWWISRDGFIRYNWGAKHATRGCSCSETSTCNQGEEQCNCDVGDSTQRMDTGVINDKDILPVKELNFGGVGAGSQASHVLGKLICTGPTVPLYRSCKALFDDPNGWAATGYYLIDADGQQGVLDPFLVYCNSGETWVTHNLCDMGCRTQADGVTVPDCAVGSYDGDRVDDCETVGCATVNIDYDVELPQMVALIDQASTSCEQALQVTCTGSRYIDGSVHQRWWYGRNDLVTQRYNWGTATGSTGCDCTMNVNNCNLAGLDATNCYCDENDGTERYDKGTIVDEATLPIVQIRNSDTGAGSESAYMNVGHLQCMGNVLVDECDTGVDACDTNALCTDTASAYTCECNDGYWGSGYDCQAIVYHIVCDEFTVIEGELSVSFNVYRTGLNANAGSVVVNFNNNDAVVTNDFVEPSIMVDFPASTGVPGNIQFVPVSVNIVNDQVAENNETFTISLSNPVNGQVPTSGWLTTATVNIIDDDTSFAIELDKYEVNEDVGYVDIAIIRWGHLGRTGSVLLTSTDDSAVAISDFAGEGDRRISFDIWEERKVVRIGLLNDYIPEETEVFWIGIEQPVDGVIVPFEMTCISVIDEDTILCPVSPTDVVLEDDTSVTIRLLRTGDLSQPGLVRYTAYINDMTSLQLSQENTEIPADSGTVDIEIDLTDDAIPETAETITFYIIDAGQDYICPENRRVIVSISDDDSAYALSDTHYTTTEGPSSTTAEIRVLRTGFLGTTGTCRLVTSEVTDRAESAIAGSDYVHRDTIVSFNNGDPYKSVFITIINDNYLESYESFVVTLSDCTNGALSQPSSAFVGIIDDDTVEEIPVLPSFTIAVTSLDVYEEEGLVSVTVNKQGSGDASVRLATYPVESSASVTQDFAPVNELLEFTNDATSRQVNIRIANDNIPEETEDIVVKLSNPINAVLGDLDRRRAVINVFDQDSVVYFRSREISVSEGAEVANIEIIRDGYLEQTQTVGVRLSYSTLPGEADAEDFTAAPISLQFSTDQSTAIIEVPISDDSEVEGRELFEVRLSVDPNYPGTLSVIEPDVVVVHILDDDDDTVETGNQLALIIGGSVAGGLVFLGVAGLALAVCFKALAARPPQQPVGAPPKYLGQPPQQPLVEFPPGRYNGYPPAYNGGYQYRL